MSIPKDEFYRDCPWCSTRSVQMINLKSNQTATKSTGGVREWTWVACPRCAGVISIESRHNSNVVLSVVPENRTEVDVKHLPADVELFYRNALTVMKAGVPSSAAVELRKTLEAAAKHHDVEARTLVASIRKLEESNLITKDFIAVLDHIRKVGNIGAHASDQEITEDELRVAFGFTTQVLRNLFEIPQELAQLSAEQTEEN